MIFAPKYKVDTKIENGELFSKIRISVEGSPKNLAVVITDPAGETESLSISKEELKSGSRFVDFNIFSFKEGTYKLAVILQDSKLVVFRKQIPVFLKDLSVEKIEILTGKNVFGSADNQNIIVGLKATIKKDGNLPIRFVNADIFINGKKCILPLVKNIYDQESHIVQIGLGGYNHKGSKLSDKYLIKGKLFYGGNKSVDFEKECRL